MGYSFCYYISEKWKVGDLQSAITANFAKQYFQYFRSERMEQRVKSETCSGFSES